MCVYDGYAGSEDERHSSETGLVKGRRAMRRWQGAARKGARSLAGSPGPVSDQFGALVCGPRMNMKALLFILPQECCFHHPRLV